jgi:parallel beta-helix repeat protein
VASNLDIASNGTGIWVVYGSGRVKRSTIHDNSGVGIQLAFADIGEIVDNRIVDNRVGIVSTDSGLGIVQRNVVMRNAFDGIFMFRSGGILLDNTFSRNGGNGVTAGVSRMCGDLNDSRVGANLADGNGGLGIFVDLPGSGHPCPPGSEDLFDAGGNAANNNGDAQQCSIEVQCARNRGQANKLTP